MSMISQADSRSKNSESGGYDVIGAIEELKVTSSNLSQQMQSFQTSMARLEKTLADLNNHYQQDFIDDKQAQADEINQHTLELLRGVEKAAEELDTESIDSLKDRLEEMSRATIKKTDKHLLEIEKAHRHSIDRAFSSVMHKWILLSVLTGTVVGMLVVLAEYITRGAELIFQHEGACIWLVIGLIGLTVWVVIYTIIHKNK